MASITKRVLLLVLWACAFAARAETPPSAPSTDESAARVTPQGSAATTAPARQRAPRRPGPSPSSDQVSSAITAGITYQPPKAKDPNEGPPVDLREIDKPINGIIRLPKYTVEGERPPIFADRSLYTAKGLADLANSRYLSKFDRSFLNRYDFLGSNAERAMQEYYDQERQRNISTTNERISMLRQTGNGAEADQMQKDAYSTYVRPVPVGMTNGNEMGVPSFLRRTP